MAEEKGEKRERRVATRGKRVWVAEERGEDRLGGWVAEEKGVETEIARALSPRRGRENEGEGELQNVEREGENRRRENDGTNIHHPRKDANARLTERK